MPELSEPYVVARGSLDQHDIAFLTSACKARLDRDGIPCFAMIDDLDSATFARITRVVADVVGEELNYLNDFYIYTDAGFKTSWHMDTELFTFESAVNAWILLSPDQVEDPLVFIADINDAPERHYHSVAIDGDDCTFRNYATRAVTTRSLRDIEHRKVHTPALAVGDIVVINPRYYHRTNVDTPKHAFSVKFVYGSEKGSLSPTQVPAILWPEVRTFNRVIAESDSWEDVLDGLRAQLTTEDGRTKLSSGFYPEQFDLYRRMIQTLPSDG